MTADDAGDAWLDGPAPWRQTRRLARALTAIESGAEAAWARAAFPRAGKAVTVGLTGPPGVGKSTLTAALARELRSRGEPVAVLAFDPTSPLTGGAVLGDRVRMSDLETDPDVFIRSMASRGAAGGLARAAAAAADLLDAAGFPWILMETVGAGQAQTQIRRNADVVVLVTAPGLGDGVQAIKSGTMEIADIFVVNKSDLPGAGAARRAIEDAIGPDRGNGERPPVIPTVARVGEGAVELLDVISRRFDGLNARGEIAARRAARFRCRVLDLYGYSVLQLALDAVEAGSFAPAQEADLTAALDAPAESQQNRTPETAGPGTVDPYRLADRLLDEFVRGLRRDGEHS